MRLRKLIQMEYGFERFVFDSRWILAPAYITLIAALGVITFSTFVALIQLLSTVNADIEASESNVILDVLTIVDLILLANLVLMIVMVGYVNFVSKMSPSKKEDWPSWIDELDYSGLKLKVMGSIVAITSVQMLRIYIFLVSSITQDTSGVSSLNYSPIRLAYLPISQMLPWVLGIYVAFLFGALFVAIMNRLERFPLDAESGAESAESRIMPTTVAKAGADEQAGKRSTTVGPQRDRGLSTQALTGDPVA